MNGIEKRAWKETGKWSLLRESSSHNRNWTVFLTDGAEKTAYTHAKKLFWTLILYTKINSKSIKDPNMRPETMNS